MCRYDDKIYKHPRSFWEKAINEWVNDEQARYSIIRNFLDNVPYERIAEELDISRGTVFNKITKYSKILFEHID